jgi:EAL domain-containing protein (putative c-di-GMP-specific phosphodiesterase class I)
MEGVENRELRDYLLKYNVTTHQGYYYSKPVRIEKFMELLDT